MHVHQSVIAKITAIKMALAALIAFLVISYFHFPEGAWALVSIAAVTQGGLSPTLIKLLMRALGTCVGALLGYGIVVSTVGHPVILLTATFFLIWFISYFAVQNTIYSYAGIVMGLTVSIIVFFALQTSDVLSIALYRTETVLLGIVILAGVSVILYYFFHHKISNLIPTKKTDWKLPRIEYQPVYTVIAFKIACACILTFLIWAVFRQPQGYWAPITCLLIMEEDSRNTIKKGFFRFFSHILAVLIAFLCILPLLHAAYFWRIIPLLFCFLGCGYLLGSGHRYAGMGNTIGIAMAVMLLGDTGGHETLYLILDRLYNVMIGISVAYFMLLLPPTQYNQATSEGA